MFWCGWPGMPKVPKVTSLQNLGKKEIRDKFNFLHEDKHQSFLETDIIVFGGHSQTCPKYPKQQFFATCLQYLKKERRHEVDFLHEDKQTFLQVDTINTGEYDQSRPNYSK